MMKMPKLEKQFQQGLTLVEMMVSVALLSLLIVGAVQAMEYLNFSQAHVDVKTTRSQELEILKLNLDNELRNVTHFFSPSTSLPSEITSDSTVSANFTLPTPSDGSGAIVAGNTLFFATSKLVPIDQFVEMPSWRDSGRFSQTTIHCLYLKRSEDDAHPGSFELVHYSNDRLVSAASSSAYYLWTNGTPPLGTDIASNNALNAALFNVRDFVAWEPTSGTVPTLPAIGAKRRTLYRYIGVDPKNASAVLDGFDVDIVRNTVNIRIKSGVFSKKQKYIFEKKLSVLTRKIKL